MPPVPPAGSSFVRAFLVLALAAGAAFVIGGTAIVRDGDRTLDLGWIGAHENGRAVVSSVDAQGPAAGRLRPGDRLLAWNADPRVQIAGTTPFVEHTRAGVPYTLRVARGGAEATVVLEAQHRSDRTNRWRAAGEYATGIAFLIVAVFIGWLRPDDGAARWLAMSLLASSLVLLRIGLSFIHLVPGTSSYVLWALVQLAPPWHALFGFEFAARFARTAASRSLSVLRALLWGGALVSLAKSALGAWARIDSLDAHVWFAVEQMTRLAPAAAAGRVVFVAALAAGAAALVSGYRLVRDPVQHRRIAWVVWGTVVGTLPLLLVQAASLLKDVLAGAPQPLTRSLSTAMLVTELFASVIPVTLAYAILRHRVFDVRVVVRRSIQYALAKQVLVGALALPAAGLVLAISSNPQLTVKELVSLTSPYLYLAAVVGVTFRYRARLRQAIDRRFFREAYDRERVLTELVADIDRYESLREAVALVTRTLEAAFHPAAIYVWFRDAEDAASPVASASGDSILNLSGTSRLVRLFEAEGQIRDVPFGNPKLDTAPEVDTLVRRGIVLLVPLLGTSERLHGLLLLGEKKSEEPYGASDRSLLQAVAKQIAIVRENTLLKAQVAQDGAAARGTTVGRTAAPLRECPQCGLCYDAGVERCTADGTPLVSRVLVERVVDGKYRLDRLVGRGGMGAVYEARDLRLDRRVAFKILLAHSFGDESALRRFEREARTVAALSHPNIVGVYDYGALPAGGAYLVMEWAPGTTWRAELTARGTLPPPMLAEWLAQMCAGLSAAHALGIVHRDLKPENVLVAEVANGGPRVKIVDFGLAKGAGGGDEAMTGLTLPGSLLGTIAYMAPEQLRGGEADARSDLFAAGVMMWEALTGERPFAGPSPQELAQAILAGPPEPPPGIRPPVAHVLKRALAPKAEERYPSIAAFGAAAVDALLSQRTNLV